MGDYVKGELAGTQQAQGNVLWALAGLGCGIFGIAAAYLYDPAPDPAYIIGKSPEYAAGYVNSYTAKTKNKNVTYSLVGWASWLLMYVAALE